MPNKPTLVLNFIFGSSYQGSCKPYLRLIPTLRSSSFAKTLPFLSPPPPVALLCRKTLGADGAIINHMITNAKTSATANRGLSIALSVFWLGAIALASRAHASPWQMKPPPLATQWTSQVNTNTPLPEYPRPQMVRSNWLNLNGIWQFEPGVTNNDPVPTDQTLSGSILVPYPMESAISGVMQYNAFPGIGTPSPCRPSGPASGLFCTWTP